jgi:hypothetical protein
LVLLKLKRQQTLSLLTLLLLTQVYLQDEQKEKAMYVK